MEVGETCLKVDMPEATLTPGEKVRRTEPIRTETTAAT
jgi:hypothetical protein